ncbi:MAG: MarR family transcriptional regulator [Planctomycetota bacterium]
MHDYQDEMPGGPQLGLIQAGRAVHAAFDAADEAVARELGVNRSDLRCLNELEHGPITPGEIGRRLGLTSGAVTTLIDRLDEAGFVMRAPSKTDRRSSVVALQPDAFRRIGPLYKAIASELVEEFAALPPSELSAATELFTRLATAVERGSTRIKDS